MRKYTWTRNGMIHDQDEGTYVHDRDAQARIGELLEIVKTASELADDAANYLTGEVVLPCDEGNAVAEGLATLAMKGRAAIARAEGNYPYAIHPIAVAAITARLDLEDQP